ncbi:MAG TPA: glycosyltransferase family 2 protein [Candidatus Limnocylindrales bacterium]|nr:glycosyltransferase family 2 protein [Candidatus Limnocylindrales bacterium]
MIDVSILMVSYNTRDLTLESLRALPAACPGLTFEIIVVDNASSDGSADAISAEFPSARVERSNENLGFARAVNLAASQATGRYLLLLNPDTVPDGPFVAELAEFAGKNPESRIYGGRTVREDGRDYLAGYKFPSIPLYLWFATGMSILYNIEELPRLDRSRPTAVPALSGCLLMIDWELWRSLEGFDPDFFMYCEDADLCWRATLAGAQPTLVPTARIIHLGGRASTSTARKVELLMRGKISFVRKHWSPPKARLGRLLLLAGVGFRAFLRREPWLSAWRTRATWRNGW